MQPLRCTDCGAAVLVQKNSWEHTSVQWDDSARSACRELAGGTARRSGAPMERCQTLTDVIEKAARTGSVSVLDNTPVRSPAQSH
ncbi:hypothetical protein KXR83_18820 [Williamsia muralis]|uniref:hypothetical protein n=1 Tax=Williamsia marianensis TaxID=85044 RepID=UPI003F13D69A